MQDGTAIPASSKNPERALMMLEQFHQNMEYWRLLAYGVEGVHYEIDASGTLKALNVDQWVPSAYCDWAVRRVDWMLPVEGQPPNYNEVWDSFYTKAVENPYAHFTVNFDKITNERAAVIATVTEYAKPLTYGYVADVEAGFAELKNKLDEAGLRVMLDEVNSQFAAFKAAN
jgi:putative aldouronate transport system substrate-binding protein